MSKSVLITGVSRGIGRSAADAFLASGWNVIGVDKNEAQGFSKNFHFINSDISDEESPARVVRKAHGIVGILDALVNNAGVQVCKPIKEVNIDDWNTLVQTNMSSVYFFVQHACTILRKPGASIVNVSSIHAFASSKYISAYAASKGGVMALTRALAVELGSDGIRVNAVLPGAVDTEMLRTGLRRNHAKVDDDQAMNKICRRTPLGRIGRPEEIAQAILFLADNTRSSFITGQSLVVDGGALARLGTE